VPSTAGGAWVLDSAHYGVYCLTAGAGAFVDFGGRTSTSSQTGTINLRNASNQTVWGVNQGGLLTSSSTTDATGHWVARRTLSNAIALWRNGASAFTGTNASTSLVAYQLYALAANTAGTAGAFSTRQLAAVHWGQSLSDAEIAALNTALSTYLTAVGAI
jgi:hypothetical protein